MATVITPNTFEAEVLSNQKIDSEEKMAVTAEEISKKYGCSVLIKGGHLGKDANDYLFEVSKGGHWLEGQRIENPNTHGTGCTLSSAIACRLAEKRNLFDSVELAKQYLTGALKMQLNLGHGSGPVDHLYNL